MKKLIAFFITAVLCSVPRFFAQETKTFYATDFYGANPIAITKTKSGESEATVSGRKSKSIFDRNFRVSIGAAFFMIDGLQTRFALRPNRFDIDFGIGLNTFTPNFYVFFAGIRAPAQNDGRWLKPQFDFDYNFTGFRKGFNYNMGLSYSGWHLIGAQTQFNLFLFGINSKFSWIRRNGFEFGMSTRLPIYGFGISAGDFFNVGIWNPGGVVELLTSIGGIAQTTLEVRFNF